VEEVMEWVKKRVRMELALHLQFLVVQQLQHLVVVAAALSLHLTLEKMVDLEVVEVVKILHRVELKMEVEQYLVLQNQHH
tara:strand:+ start:125 stop:364 length:240 start_codon:yes stop_codon:yes gene_type:complete